MRSTCSGSSSFGSKAIGSWMSARPSPRRGFSARRYLSGAGPLWQTSKTSRSHVTRCCTSRRLVGTRSKLGSRPISPSAATPNSSESCACLSSSIRFASDSAASSCSPSIGQGRQADALDVYAEARRTLVSELGLEPGAALQRLQQAILEQEQMLDLGAPASAIPLEPSAERVVVALVRDLDGVDALGSVGRVSTSGAGGELIFVHIAAPATLGAATAALSTAQIGSQTERDRPGSLPSRRRPRARMSSASPCARMPTRSLPTSAKTRSTRKSWQFLTGAPCDVVLVVRAGGAMRPGPVLVPFGAAEHDWAALRARGLARTHDGAAASADRQRGGTRVRQGRKPAPRRRIARTPARHRGRGRTTTRAGRGDRDRSGSRNSGCPDRRAARGVARERARTCAPDALLRPAVPASARPAGRPGGRAEPVGATFTLPVVGLRVADRP